MPRKRKPVEKPPEHRKKGEGSYRYDQKNNRHIWRIVKHGQRYEIADRDSERASTRFAALLKELESGRSVSDSRQTFTVYVDYYCRNVLPNLVDTSTQADYIKRLNRYALPTIGSYQLCELKKPILQAWVNAMAAHGWAVSSVKQILSLVRRILETAVPEILEYNPANGVVAPQAKQRVHEDDEEDSGRALTHEETARLRQLVAGTFYEALYEIALVLGLRRGEILGLQWKDVNFEKHELRIRRQVRRQDRLIEVSPKLKTAASRRVLPLSDHLIAVLQRHQAIVYALQLKAEAWEDADFVFPNERGGYRRPDNLTTHTSRLFKRLGIEGHHLHDLRATAITRWRENGADDETTSALAGHEDVKISAKVYSDTLARERMIIERVG